MTPRVAGGELTLDRVIEIEQRRGKPPTKQELAEYETHTAEMAPVLRKLAPSRRTCSQIRRARAIYRALPPGEQMRWGDRTPAQLLAHAHVTRPTPRRAATTSRARPRGRRAAARAGESRDGPGDPDPEPPDLAGIPIAAFRRELQRALGGVA
jgi:hypothetical protein